MKNKSEEVLGICPSCKKTLTFTMTDGKFFTKCSNCKNVYTNMINDKRSGKYRDIDVDIHNLNEIKYQIEYMTDHLKTRNHEKEVQALNTAIDFFNEKPIDIEDLEKAINLLSSIKLSWELTIAYIENESVKNKLKKEKFSIECIIREIQNQLVRI